MSDPRALARQTIVQFCHNLVEQAGFLHYIEGTERQVMAAAYQELFGTTLGLTTGSYELAPAATPMTHLSGVIANLLQYAVYLDVDRLENDQAFLDDIGVVIAEIRSGLDAAREGKTVETSAVSQVVESEIRDLARPDTLWPNADEFTTDQG